MVILHDEFKVWKIGRLAETLLMNDDGEDPLNFLIFEWR
jgi:hypothetical protein